MHQNLRQRRELLNHSAVMVQSLGVRLPTHEEMMQYVDKGLESYYLSGMDKHAQEFERIPYYLIWLFVDMPIKLAVDVVKWANRKRMSALFEFFFPRHSGQIPCLMQCRMAMYTMVELLAKIVIYALIIFRFFLFDALMRPDTFIEKALHYSCPAFVTRCYSVLLRLSLFFFFVALTAGLTGCAGAVCHALLSGVESLGGAVISGKATATAVAVTSGGISLFYGVAKPVIALNESIQIAAAKAAKESEADEPFALVDEGVEYLYEEPDSPTPMFTHYA